MEGQGHGTRVLVTCHSSADADALGCLVACSVLFEGCTILWPGSFDDALNEIVKSYARPSIPSIKTLREIHENEEFDVVVVVDTANKKRCAHVSNWIAKAKTVICIDHHEPGPDDLEKLDARWCVRWGAASSIILGIIVGSLDPLKPVDGSVVAKCLEQSVGNDARSWRISPTVATLMLCGIHADTGSFRYPLSTPFDVLACFFLMKCQPSMNFVYDYLSAISAHRVENFTESQIHVLKQLRDSFQTHELGNGETVGVAIAETEHECSNFSEVVRWLLEESGQVALFCVGCFGRSGKLVLVGRSTDESNINCGLVCKSFGGGGHKNAAAASLRALDFTVNTARERLFSVLRDLHGPSILLGNIMTKTVIGIPCGTNVAEASRIMVERGLKKAPVFGVDGKPVGLLDKLSLDKAIKLRLENQKAHEFAQALPPWLPPSAKMGEAVEKLLAENCRMVFVKESEDSKLLGIVSRSDVIGQLLNDPFLQIPLKSSKDRSFKVNFAGKAPEATVKFLRKAGKMADALGMSLYVVGGFPRDVLLGRDNDDIDFVVAGGEASVFARALYEKFGDPSVAVLEHDQFHTAVVTLKNGDKVDVATARMEYYPLPASLPIVELSSLKMDLSRRDFTINALAIQLNTASFGCLVDFFHSRSDISSKTISVLHTLSFVEDPTRMFRCARFACRFGFHLSAVTKRLLVNAVETKVAAHLTGSRIFHELEKILAEKDPVPCFSMLHEFGVLSCIHPDMQDIFSVLNVQIALEVWGWFNQLYPLDGLGWKCVLLVLCWEMKPKAFNDTIVRLMLPKTKPGEMEEAFTAVHKASMEVREWLHSGTERQVSALCKHLKALKTVEAVIALLAHLKMCGEDWAFVSKYVTYWRFVTPTINGNDLKKIGISPGPIYAKILSVVLDAILDGRVSMEFEQQIAFVKKMDFK